MGKTEVISCILTAHQPQHIVAKIGAKNFGEGIVNISTYLICIMIMRIQSNLLIFISLLIVLLFIFPSQAFGQKTDQELLDIVIDREFKDITLIYVLDSIRQDYEIPIVFEVADSGYTGGNPVDLNTYDIDLEAGKLSDVLDSIIRQRPNYKWEIIDGVVNFTPITNRNPLIEKLFNTQIQSFSLKSYTFSNEIDRKLEVIPEVAELLKLNDTTINNIYNFSFIVGASYPKHEVNLTLSNVTFKELLNNIAKRSPANFWLVHLKTLEIEGKTKKILYL